jgi:hypothetical protein
VKLWKIRKKCVRVILEIYLSQLLGELIERGAKGDSGVCFGINTDGKKI